MATGALVANIQALGIKVPTEAISMFIGIADEALADYEGAFTVEGSYRRAGEILAAHLIALTRERDRTSYSIAGVSETFQGQYVLDADGLKATRFGRLFLQLYGDIFQRPGFKVI